MDITPAIVGLGTLLLSVVAAVFKGEIASLYRSWSLYHARPFDQDRKPDTPDRCQLYNPSTGGWEDILIEKYQFSLKPDRSGVFICHTVTTNGKACLAKERISFDDWAKMRKRSMPKAD
ncbi:MAG: hypothetical protein O2890_03120 [Cyanobacteria bacterium]|nr:hypothetical protein [Cyanobacteriota bacterium]MDA0865406.1 hypothetical protein [Cyanobacteriota bacterium]